MRAILRYSLKKQQQQQQKTHFSQLLFVPAVPMESLCKLLYIHTCGDLKMLECEETLKPKEKK